MFEAAVYLLCFYVKLFDSRNMLKAPVCLMSFSVNNRSCTCLKTLFIGFRSVAVITFASHAKGPRFEPGRKQASLLSMTVSSEIKWFSQIIRKPTQLAPSENPTTVHIRLYYVRLGKCNTKITNVGVLLMVMQFWSLILKTVK